MKISARAFYLFRQECENNLYKLLLSIDIEINNWN